MIVKTNTTEVTADGPVNWEATGLFNLNGRFTVFIRRNDILVAEDIQAKVNSLTPYYKFEMELIKCLERAILSDSTNSPKSDTSASSSTLLTKQNC